MPETAHVWDPNQNYNRFCLRCRRRESEAGESCDGTAQEDGFPSRLQDLLKGSSDNEVPKRVARLLTSRERDLYQQSSGPGRQAIERGALDRWSRSGV